MEKIRYKPNNSNRNMIQYINFQHSQESAIQWKNNFMKF